MFSLQIKRSHPAQSPMRRFQYALACTALATACASAAHAQGRPPQAPPPPDPYGFHLDHVTTVVADLDKAAEWYAQTLGFQKSGCITRGGEFRACQMRAPGAQIDLVEQKGSTRNKRGGFNDQGWLHVVLKTGKLSELYSALQAKHITIEGGPDPRGNLRMFTIHDPEGNEIELVAE